jgi:hypothetical protein
MSGVPLSQIYICVGGEVESLATEQFKDIVVLKHRKGFVRLALQYGAALVPTYGFGVTDMYTTLSWGKGFRNWCVRARCLPPPQAGSPRTVRAPAFVVCRGRIHARGL